MTPTFPDAARARLPAPYRDATFVHRRRGTFDDSEVDVFVDALGAFAVLNPCPVMDYAHYVARQKKLGLGAYKKTLDVVSRRFAKIADLIPDSGTVLEIGASDGSFLAKVAQERKAVFLVAVEPDQDSKTARNSLQLAGDFVDLDAAAAAGAKADTICLFHVFEHISDPAAFLAAVGRVLKPGGRVIIEVPSLDDPLLSLYRLPAYEAFYFQRQHPFVYSRSSLARVIEAQGWRVIESRPYQRYGLENHLGWLVHGKPGGDGVFAAVFAGIDAQYRAALEAKGETDTVFVAVEAA